MDSLAAVRAPTEWHVPVGQSVARRGPGIVSCVGLGSCVALVLYDRGTRIGAVAHILLPHEALSRVPGGPAKYATTAARHLLAEMRAVGEVVAPEARLVGGASMFGALLKGGGVNMGERNVLATRRALVAAHVPVIGEDVGGDYGRSAWLDLESGALRVTSLRHGERTL